MILWPWGGLLTHSRLDSPQSQDDPPQHSFCRCCCCCLCRCHLPPTPAAKIVSVGSLAQARDCLFWLRDRVLMTPTYSFSFSFRQSRLDIIHLEHIHAFH